MAFSFAQHGHHSGSVGDAGSAGVSGGSESSGDASSEPLWYESIVDAICPTPMVRLRRSLPQVRQGVLAAHKHQDEMLQPQKPDMSTPAGCS
jgi:hypothetical protein